VAIARAKGVNAFVCNFWDAARIHGGGSDMVYADGLVGHLLADHSLADVLTECRRLVRPGGLILISNDSAENSTLQKHLTVPGFSYVHIDYFAATALAIGVETEFAVRFPYMRPVSGRRWRSVVAMRA
jgi:SAM-dependent methyltransferase